MVRIRAKPFSSCSFNELWVHEREKQHLASKTDLNLAIAMSNAWICGSRVRGSVSAKQPQAVKDCH